MDKPTPPPIPPPIASPPPPASPEPLNELNAAYNIVADKVGGLPNLRKRDNLYQGIAILVCLLIGAGIGVAIDGWPLGAGLGALIGTISGLLLSGIVLMVIGLIRKP